MKKFIEIGEIVSIKGLDGTMKVLSDFDKNDFHLLEKVKIDEKEYFVKKYSKHKNFLLLLLDEISTPEKAQNFVGKIVQVERKDIVLKNGDYLVDDLLEMQVNSSDGKDLGKLFSVENFGSKDVWTTKKGKNEIVFCLVEDLIENIDYEKNVITLNSQKLGEVVYEDWHFIIVPRNVHPA